MSESMQKSRMMKSALALNLGNKMLPTHEKADIKIFKCDSNKIDQAKMPTMLI